MPANQTLIAPSQSWWVEQWVKSLQYSFKKGDLWMMKTKRQLGENGQAEAGLSGMEKETEATWKET